MDIRLVNDLGLQSLHLYADGLVVDMDLLRVFWIEFVFLHGVSFRLVLEDGFVFEATAGAGTGGHGSGLLFFALSLVADDAFERAFFLFTEG